MVWTREMLVAALDQVIEPVISEHLRTTATVEPEMLSLAIAEALTSKLKACSVTVEDLTEIRDRARLGIVAQVFEGLRQTRQQESSAVGGCSLEHSGQAEAIEASRRILAQREKARTGLAAVVLGDISAPGGKDDHHIVRGQN